MMIVAAADVEVRLLLQVVVVAPISDGDLFTDFPCRIP